MATMNDIAREAGVSRGTVSNVLNGRGGVSYEKIRLVEEAASRLGYSLDQRASTLRKGVSESIALIIPDISEKKYSELYMGILSAAKRFDCKVCLYISGDQPYKEREVILEAMKEKVMGILTVSCLEQKHQEYASFLTGSLPVIFLERKGGDGLCSHTFDMAEAARLASEAIPDASRISLLTDALSFGDQAGFMEELMRRAPIDQSRIFENRHGELSPASYELAAAFPDTDCCIAGSERLARLAENAFLRFTGQAPCLLCLAPLSPVPDNHCIQIQLNYRELGISAVNELMRALGEKNAPRSRVLNPSRICRGSMAKGNPAPSFGRTGCTLRMLSHNTPTVSALKTLVPQFRKSTGIQVDIVTVPLSELLARALSGEERWDVIRVDPSCLALTAPRIYRPLEEIDRESGAYFSCFLDSIPEDYSRSGSTLYAFPFDISMQLLFYRKSLFESVAQQRAFYEEHRKPLKIPESYEDLETVARFFTRTFRAESPTPYGASIAAHTSQTSLTSEYLPRLICAGGPVYTPAGMINLQTEAAVSALEGYMRFSRFADSAHTHDWSEVASGFVNGSYATTILYLHYASQFIRAEGAAFNGDIGFAPLPGGNSLLAGGCLGVGRFSSRPQEAYEFIRWAAGPDVATDLVMLGGISSAAIVYEQQQVIDVYPWLKYLSCHIRDAISRPLLSFRSFSYDQKEFEYQLGRNLLDALSGRRTPQEALGDAQKYLRSLSRKL